MCCQNTQNMAKNVFQNFHFLYFFFKFKEKFVLVLFSDPTHISFQQCLQMIKHNVEGCALQLLDSCAPEMWKIFNFFSYFTGKHFIKFMLYVISRKGKMKYKACWHWSFTNGNEYYLIEIYFMIWHLEQV